MNTPSKADKIYQFKKKRLREMLSLPPDHNFTKSELQFILTHGYAELIIINEIPTNMNFQIKYLTEEILKHEFSN